MSEKDERIELNEDRRKALEAEITRTGVGPWAFTNSISNPPLPFTYGTIEAWRSGKVKTTSKKLYFYVLEKYRELPDNTEGLNTPLRKGNITITKEMRAFLISEFERSGLNVAAVLRMYPVGAKKPADVTLGKWRDGRVNSAKETQWNIVLKILASLPDKQQSNETTPQDNLIVETTMVSGFETVRTPVRYPDAEYVKITEEMQQFLHDEITRTTVSPKQLMGIHNTAPIGLKASYIQNWHRGTTKKADRRFLEWVFEHYKALPKQH